MITIYGDEVCSFCIRAKKLCEKYNMKYTYKNISEESNYQEMKQIAPNSTTIPQILWYDKHIGGYSDLVSEIENTREFGQGSF